MADRQKILAKLFSAHASELKGFLRRRMGRASDSDDFVQEVYVRMLRLKDIESVHNARGYLFTVANNLRRELLYTAGPRRDLVRMSLEEALEKEPQFHVQLAPDLEIDREEESQQLDAAIETLSDRDRQLLAMYFRDGLTYRQIASQLGWASHHAAEKAVGGAVKRCREAMIRLGAV